MSQTVVAPAATEDPVRTDAPRDGRAIIVFVVGEAVAAVVYFVNGRNVWFSGVLNDEWDFLAGRNMTPGSLLERHGDHLVALPALVFRLLFTAIGLRSYVPYQALSIGLHLAAAALLLVVMRRANVGPWIATAAATVFVFFGSGSQDILIAFQITFSGAVVFGLAQLLFADHDGRVDRRDAIGLAFGLAALLCSNVAFAMIGAVGVACLIRRRWHAAALHTLPFAMIYLVWSRVYGRSPNTTLSPHDYWESVHMSVGSTFRSLGQVPLVGWLLGALLVAGLVFAIRDRDREARRQLAAPIALLAGAFCFVSLIGLTRFGLSSVFAASSRYQHVIAALVLPALAVAADALARLHRALGALALVLLLVGIPGNIGAIADNIFPAAQYAHTRQVLTTLAQVPLARTVPRGVHPVHEFAPEVTVGWLLDGAASGRIPRRTPRRGDLPTNTLRLSLDQSTVPARPGCSLLRGPTTRRLETGESVGVRGTVGVQLVDVADGRSSAWLPYGRSLTSSGSTHRLDVVSGPLVLQIRRLSLGAAVC